MRPHTRVAYVAGPYRGPTMNHVWQNIEEAKDVAKELWRMGYTVICPHANTAFFDGIVPDGTFLVGDLELLKRCDVVVMMAGWAGSEGAMAERLEAKRECIPIRYWPEDREQLLCEVRPQIHPMEEYAMGGGPDD